MTPLITLYFAAGLEQIAWAVVMHENEEAVAFLTDPWFLSSLGWFTYNFLIFMIAKNKVDRSRRKWGWKDFKNFGADYWDDWIGSALFIVITALYAPDITETLAKYYEVDIEFKEWFYLLSGPLSQAAIFGLKWLGSLDYASAWDVVAEVVSKLIKRKKK